MMERTESTVVNRPLRNPDGTGIEFMQEWKQVLVFQLTEQEKVSLVKHYIL